MKGGVRINTAPRGVYVIQPVEDGMRDFTQITHSNGGEKIRSPNRGDRLKMGIRHKEKET